jgi:hypothetical protein
LSNGKVLCAVPGIVGFHVFVCTTSKETISRSTRYRHHLHVSPNHRGLREMYHEATCKATRTTVLYRSSARGKNSRLSINQRRPRHLSLVDDVGAPLGCCPITNRRYRSGTHYLLQTATVASAHAFATVCGTVARTPMTHSTHKGVDRYSEEWLYRRLPLLHSHRIRITLGRIL